MRGNLRKGGLKRLTLPSQYLRDPDDRDRPRDRLRFRDAILELKVACDSGGVEFGFRDNPYVETDQLSDPTIWDHTQGRPRLSVLCYVRSSGMAYTEFVCISFAGFPEELHSRRDPD